MTILGTKFTKSQHSILSNNIQGLLFKCGFTDDPLKQAFKEIETDVPEYNFKDRRLGSHPKFMQPAADTGMTYIVANVRFCAVF